MRWLALEMMHNRAHATAARLALAQRRNAATLAADATEALETWIPPRTLAAIYCNHPVRRTKPARQTPEPTSRRRPL